MRYEKRLAPFLALGVLLASSGALAIKVPTGTEDVTLNISVLFQPRVEGDWDGPTGSSALASPSGHFNTDFSIRRARLIASGTAYENFTFYIMLDTPRFGTRGSYAGSTFVQDLYVGYVPVKDVNIELGFLYMPLSHASLASNSQTLAIEGVGDILQYNNARGSRETGVQLRALLFDRWILLRGGAYEGARATTAAPTRNPQGTPLVGGIARLNLIGDETGYSYPTLYYDGKTRVSVGVGAQYQPRGGALQNATTGSYNDFIALAADVFANIALPGDTEASLTLGAYRFDWGTGKPQTGNGLHGELGYRFGSIAPEVNFYWFNSDPKTNSSFKVAGGFNFFFRKHNAKLQAEFASIKNEVNLDTSPAVHQILVQAQISL